ncbi:ATP-binding protein [Streptomyces sp. NPDC050145]|uniref:ATP-binding protein n=1 Tax=Streptomyces sp. NPDC050145 TaxID=3365602 RepID=UPI00379078DF
MSGHSGYEMEDCVEALRGALASHGITLPSLRVDLPAFAGDYAPPMGLVALGNCNTGTARRLVDALGGRGVWWEVELAARGETVRAVRREVGARYGREAELCVAELLNNVVRHVGEGVAARVRVRAGGAARRVRVEVIDPAVGALPVLVVARGDDESGRGLALVDAVALAWGIEVRGEGKAVWFEVGVV